MKKMEAYNASRADEDQMLNPLRVLQGVGGCQVTPHAVTHQHHLFQPHLFSPLVKRCNEEVLGRQAIFCREGRPACNTTLLIGFKVRVYAYTSLHLSSYWSREQTHMHERDSPPAPKHPSPPPHNPAPHT